MKDDENPSNLISLRASGRYKPELTSLACNHFAAVKQRTGLSRTEFAAALQQLLDWEPSPELIKQWETKVPPPGDVIVAAETVAAGAQQRAAAASPQSTDDVVAAAANEADADRLRLRQACNSRRGTWWQRPVGNATEIWAARPAHVSPAGHVAAMAPGSAPTTQRAWYRLVCRLPHDRPCPHR